MELKDRLKNLRESRNLTQSELAKKTGITARQIQNYEMGTSRPTITSAKKLAAVFECPLDELLGYDGMLVADAKEKEQRRQGILILLFRMLKVCSPAVSFRTRTRTLLCLLSQKPILSQRKKIKNIPPKNIASKIHNVRYTVQFLCDNIFGDKALHHTIKESKRCQ